MAQAEMTTYELFSLMAKFEEVNMIATGLWVSVISGFLVMSYTIGDKLTRLQVWFVSFLFVLMSMVFGYAAIAYAAGSEYVNPSNFLSPDRQPYLLINTNHLFAIHNISLMVGCLTILGSLLFLYDIRKRAAQENSETESAQNAEEMVDEKPTTQKTDTPLPKTDAVPEASANTAREEDQKTE